MTDKELKNLVASLAVQQQETARALKESKLETDMILKETVRALKESKLEVDEALKDLKRETDKAVKISNKNNRSIRSLRELGFNIGEAVEEFFYESFKRKPGMGTIKFDEVVNKFKISSDMEFDIVLINDIYVGLIEVKHKMRPNDVKKFLKKIPGFKKNVFGKYENYKLVAGLASYVYSENSDQIAQNNGLFLFSRFGQKLRTLNNDDFKAKEF